MTVKQTVLADDVLSLPIEKNFPERCIFYGDNKDVMKGMNENTIDLIITDPPYNSKKIYANPADAPDKAEFKDIWVWEEETQGEWFEALPEHRPDVWAMINAIRVAHGNAMGAYIAYMYQRLHLMERVLRPGGQIYLLCDQHANSCLRMALTLAFGKDNFVGEIIWHLYNRPKRNLGFRQHTATFLHFYKGDKKDMKTAIWTPPKYKHEPKTEENYKLVDDDGRRYRLKTYAIEKSYPDEPRYRWYLDDGVGMDNVFSYMRKNELEYDVSPIRTTKCLYPTQKPVGPFQILIAASSQPGDVVLDPFCGGGTTMCAAEIEGRNWVGIDHGAEARNLIRMQFGELGLAVDGHEPGKLQWGSVSIYREPPRRTDNGYKGKDHKPMPEFELALVRVKPLWEGLNDREMRVLLAQAQQVGVCIYCACCGARKNSLHDMDLDHDTPRKNGGHKAKDTIDNRLLLCRRCSLLKRNTHTLVGTRKELEKIGRLTSGNRSMGQNAVFEAVKLVDRLQRASAEGLKEMIRVAEDMDKRREEGTAVDPGQLSLNDNNNRGENR